MNIIHNSLYKIDLTANTATPLPYDNSGTELNSYVSELLDTILASADKKSFVFESDTTEVRQLLHGIVTAEINDEEVYTKNTAAIAYRFLLKEAAAQDRLNNLGKKILRGIVVISL